MPVSFFSVRPLFTRWGLIVLAKETIYILLPLLLLSGLAVALQWKRRPRPQSERAGSSL